MNTTTPEVATAVYAADTAAKALTERVDKTSLSIKASRVRIAATRPQSEATLRALIASCDRDVFGEVVASHGFDPLAPLTREDVQP